ncbi:molybdopterin-binding protein [Corynebacterium pseudotuberculosis]|nr:molybdopterin-binding protein [Corynebacterium pseudotuberculosis]
MALILITVFDHEKLECCVSSVVYAAPKPDNKSEQERAGRMVDTPSIESAIIVVSDRIASGLRENKASGLIRRMISEQSDSFQSTVVVDCVVPEGYDSVVAAINTALKAGAQLVITAGGTGIRAKNQTPEATSSFIHTRYEGLEQHIVMLGSKHTPLAGLSRGIVGVTGRDADAALIINAPSSSGGIKDTWSVMAPVIPNIFEGLRA